MKALKIVIVALLVFAGGRVTAQNLFVVNNSSVDFFGDVFFSCPPQVNFSASAGGGTWSGPLPCASPTFTIAHFFVRDNTCTPPRSVTLTPYSTLGASGSYTLCSGITISYVLIQSGTNYNLFIN